MAAADQIAGLTTQGRYHFSTAEIARIMGTSPSATRSALRRLREKGLIATPHRGFHVIVAPEYRSVGCLPADQFLGNLMEHLGLSYYVAILSAARYHGAAHQQPQIFQVMVQKNRPPIECGDVRVAFAARRNIEEIPTQSFNTSRGPVLVSSPAATALDLIGYPAHAGGLDHSATVLAELYESLDPKELEFAAALSPTSWAQRLGYVLSFMGANEHADSLFQFLGHTRHETVLLDPSGAERHPGLTTRKSNRISLSAVPWSRYSARRKSPGDPWKGESSST